MQVIDPDDIRTSIFRCHIEPARRRGATSVQLTVSQICQELGTKSSEKRVCSTLRDPRLERDFKVRVLETSGPGCGTAAFTIVLAPEQLVEAKGQAAH